MCAPSSSPTSNVKRRRTSKGRWLRVVMWVTVLAVGGWFGWLYFEINAVAAYDEARPADAIAVFGAAEYAGRPSPVLHARLDHAWDLYRGEMRSPQRRPQRW